MYLAPWLKSIRNRVTRTHKRRRPARPTRRIRSEDLEKRTLLTVTGVAVGTELTVFVDSVNDITVQRNTTTDNIEILENGSAVPTVPLLDATTLTGLHFLGGDQDNSIDLSGLTATAFPALSTITVDTADGEDVIIGSDAFAESLAGGDGHDTITGNSGNDTLDGGDGDDSLLGVAGDDSLIGGNGADTLDGDAGDDTLSGGDGDDSLLGAAGDDSANGGQGADVIDGSTGNDSLSGSSGNDTITGDIGDDTVFGGADDDSILGGDGDDDLSGEGGDDIIGGEADDDIVRGGSGADSLEGGDGVDLIIGGAGQDTAFGDGGDDTIRGGGGSDVLYGDTATGSSLPGDDIVRGQGGHDTIYGGGGTDSLDGGAGDDFIDSFFPVTALLSIDDVQITEGDLDSTGNPVTTTASFTVTLSEASESEVTVDFETFDVTATAGIDYTYASDTLRFAPGELQQTFAISVLGDNGIESNETFVVNLTNPSNAAFAVSQATATIVDDDSSTSSISTSNFPADWDRDTDSTQWVVALDSEFDATSLEEATDGIADETTLLEDTYILDIGADGDASELIATLESLEGVVDYYPLDAINAQVRAVPDDPLYADQWHLSNTGQTGGTVGADANVETAWDSVLGTGVTIAIVDDGLEHTHPDLVGNYDASLSFDYFDGDADPIPDTNFDFHGTSVAGVAAADGFNALGVSGAAPDATLAGVRLVAGFFTDQQSADALGHMTQQIDISNNSWGPADNGTISAPGPLSAAALADGATNGRGGLGTIYVWAGGNGGDLTEDNVNYDGFANSRYTVAVGSIDHNGVRSVYSDPGAPLIVTAYSNDLAGVGITTTDLTGGNGYNSVADASDFDPLADLDYTSTFGGTSSAAPLVSGVIALVLEASPNLTYRDVNHILVNSASMTDPTNADWTTNSAGHDINHNYGFGAIDATAAVQLAQTWTNVASEVSTTSGTQTVGMTIPDNDATGVSSTVSVAGDVRAEYVEVVLNATHALAGDLEVVLTSPSGTQSVLAESRTTGTFSDYSNWTFTSARHWDELAQGNWTLTIRDLTTGTVGTFDDWSLNVFGTLNQTAVAPPAPAPVVTLDAGGDIIVGGSGNDTLQGNDANDTISGGDGNDSLLGGNGDDLLMGEAGKDTLHGEDGDDTLFGQGADDRLDGGSGVNDIHWDGVNNGNDVIVESLGVNRLIIQGDDSADNYTVDPAGNQLRVSSGNASVVISDAVAEVRLITGGGNDTVTVTSVANVNPVLLTIDGEAGDDVLTASGADIGRVRMRMSGGDGNDSIVGSLGNDFLNGDAGEDTISGSSGDDKITGGDGNDEITGDRGDDEVDGGIGNDTINGGLGNDTLNGSFDDDFILGDRGHDTINGGFGNDIVVGNAGNDLVDGNQGDDSVYGGAGDDSLDGGAGHDYMRGHSGNDVMKGGDGDDEMYGDNGDDTMSGGDGDDVIEGREGFSVIDGGDGNDKIVGGALNDTLIGGDGNDTVFGGAGNDRIFGGDGDDKLKGHGSTDLYNSGEGDDTLIGLTGNEFDNLELQMGSAILKALAALNGI